MTDTRHAAEIYCDETEGWPYDGRQRILRRTASGEHELVETSRHIDADGERVHTTPMSPLQALSWLQREGVSFPLLQVYFSPLLDQARIVAAHGEEPRRVIRQLSESLFFLELSGTTSDRERAEDEQLLHITLPRLGRVVGWFRDRAHAHRQRREGAVMRPWMARLWLSRDGLEEELHSAGWDSEQIAALLPPEDDPPGV